MSVQNGLKICFDGEEELVDENAFESSDVVLLVEHQHGLFVADCKITKIYWKNGSI